MRNAGFKCYVVYTPPRSAWYGLVMINPYANGDVDVGIGPAPAGF